MPWFFALGHTNYARWIPVHPRDMVTLATKHASIYAHFLAGNFTVKKTNHVFSTMAIDQAREQNNASVKCNGGAMGPDRVPCCITPPDGVWFRDGQIDCLVPVNIRYQEG